MNPTTKRKVPRYGRIEFSDVIARKLEDMEDRLRRLEALMERKGTEDGKDSKRSDKRHIRREGSKEVDSRNLKRHRAQSSRREASVKEDLRLWYARQEGGGHND